MLAVFSAAMTVLRYIESLSLTGARGRIFAAEALHRLILIVMLRSTRWFHHVAIDIVKEILRKIYGSSVRDGYDDHPIINSASVVSCGDPQTDT